MHVSEGPAPGMTKAFPEPRLQVGMMLLPGLTALDLIGTHMTLWPVTDVHLVSKTLDPVRSDQGVDILPTATFETCPKDLDIIFVPGGEAMLDAASDDELLDFIVDRASRARYVTAVCTGSVILGVAGLLEGYRAATHWVARDILAHSGVGEVVTDRVVIDGNRITGGGVTAGIDFGLTLVMELFGPDVAKMVQLGMEYDPRPPFDAGTPDRPDTDPRAVEAVRRMTGPLNQLTIAAVKAGRERRAARAGLDRSAATV